MFTFHQPYALTLGVSKVSGFFVAYAFAALIGRMLIIGRIDGRDRRAISGRWVGDQRAMGGFHFHSHSHSHYSQ